MGADRRFRKKSPACIGLKVRSRIRHVYPNTMEDPVALVLANGNSRHIRRRGRECLPMQRSIGRDRARRHRRWQSTPTELQIPALQIQRRYRFQYVSKDTPTPDTAQPFAVAYAQNLSVCWDFVCHLCGAAIDLSQIPSAAQ